MKRSNFMLGISATALFITVYVLFSQIYSNKNINPDPAHASTPKESLEGNLQVLIEDDFKNNTSVKKYYLQEDNNLVTRINYNGDLTVAPGSRIKIAPTNTTTYKTSRSLDINSQNNIEVINQIVTQSAGAALGNSKIAVILANFTNLTANNPSKSTAKTYMDTKFSPNIAEMSFNKTTISADVYGWVNMGISATCDLGIFAPKAITAADSQINYNNYKYVMIVVPEIDPSCGYGGLAYFPPGPTYVTSEGTKNLLVSALPDRYFLDWIQTNGVHEVGHNMGLDHAHGWECGLVQTGPACTAIPYGDWFDIMGGGGYAYSSHYGAYNKEFLGWLGANNIQTVTSSGTYTVQKLETLSSVVQSLKIPMEGSNTFYNLESRTATGYDAGLPTNAVSGGLLKIIPNNIANNVAGIPNIIDITPGSQVNPPGYNGTDIDFNDAGFTINKTFTDSDRGITIKPISKSNGVLTVKVTFNGPTLLSPANGAGTASGYFEWNTIPKATNYTLRVSDSSTFSTTLINTAVSGTKYTIPSLGTIPKNKTLYWSVKANYSFGVSDWSPTWTTVIPYFGGLSATTDTSKATFNFTYPISNTFVVEMANTADFSTGIYRNFGSGNGSPVIVNDPTKWDKYSCGAMLWWRVYSGDAVYSPIQSVKIVCLTPTPTPGPTIPVPTLISPANNAVEATSQTSLTWKPIIPTPYNYEIQLSKYDHFVTKVNGFPKFQTSTTVYLNNLPAGTYYWRVRARISSGVHSWISNGPWSNVWSFEKL